MIYDITRTITPQIAVWDGDSPFSVQQVLAIREGSSVNLTTLTLSAHTGTHADAPWHYKDNGEHPDQLPLDKYIGSAHVAHITRQHGGIVPADFAGHDLTGMKRLLVRTWCSDLPDSQFPQDFPYPTVELIDWLAERGVVLFGVDMPSVDDYHSKTLDCHHSMYELIALPLKIGGVCGSPIRAVLRVV
jgi:arylformamidase